MFDRACWCVDQENLGGVPPVETPVAVIRPPEPTVTPQTIRAGLYQYARERFGDEAFFPDLTGKIKRLMPRNRIDAIDYFEAYPFEYNAGGTMNAADSISNNYMIQRGLAEGWVQLGDDMQFTYNRGAAFELDRGEFDLAQASRIDEVAEIERYNQTLARNADQTDPASQEVQNALDPATRDAQEAARQYDDFETGQGSPNAALYKAGKGSQLEGGELADAALVEAKRQEQLAAVQTDAAENAEQLQIDVDAIAAYGDIGSDRQVVAEMLNLDLDRLPKYAIEKIGNRQYQVVDELGESVDGNTYSTLKGARKGADVATKAQRKEYIAKARAMADRATDQPVKSRMGVEFTESPLVRGELSLTKRQAEVLNELGIPVETLKFDLSQADLAGMSTSIKQLMEGASPTQKRVLGNILKRVDERVIDLIPQARLRAEVDKTQALAQKFLKDGEICY